jgi:hypothetical protein
VVLACCSQSTPENYFGKFPQAGGAYDSFLRKGFSGHLEG